MAKMGRGFSPGPRFVNIFLKKNRKWAYHLVLG